MKKVISILVLLSVALFGETTTKNSKYSESMCKIFKKKIVDYEKKMRNDEYAKVTLQSYKHRAKIYCTK